MTGDSGKYLWFVEISGQDNVYYFLTKKRDIQSVTKAVIDFMVARDFASANTAKGKINKITYKGTIDA